VPVLVTWCGLVFIPNHHLIFPAAVAIIQRKLGTTPLLFQERREIHMISFQIHLFPFSAMPDHVMCEKFRDFGYMSYTKMQFFFEKTKWKLYGMHNNVVFVCLWVRATPTD